MISHFTNIEDYFWEKYIHFDTKNCLSIFGNEKMAHSIIANFRNTNCLPTFKRVAAAPPISNKGDSAICAFFTAVTVFVRPMEDEHNSHPVLYKLSSLDF